MGFRLPDLNLTLAYSKGQLGSWNGAAKYCTIMYCEQTAGPRSANFCTHMHVDKVHSSANFYFYRRSPWSSFFKIRDSNEYIGTCIMHSSLQAYRHGCSSYGANGWYQSPRFQGGVRNWSRLPFAKIWVLAYSLILSNMQRIAILPTASISVWQCVCAYVCACSSVWMPQC